MSGSMELVKAHVKHKLAIKCVYVVLIMTYYRHHPHTRHCPPLVRCSEGQGGTFKRSEG